MKMQIAIIEDEVPARKHLLSLLSQLEKQIEVVFEATSVKEAVRHLQQKKPLDLIFMDVQLNDGLSFEIFKQAEVACPVVFTTAYDQYMLEAFHENSIDYLLKPIKRADLEHAFQKLADLKAHFAPNFSGAIRQLGEEGTGIKKRFLVKKGVSYKSVQAGDIAYCFSEHKVTFLVNRSGERLIYEKPLAELEANLDPAQFFRVNRKYIAAMQAIESFRSYEKGKLLVKLVPDTKEEVVVSQEKAAVFREWMGGGSG